MTCSNSAKPWCAAWDDRSTSPIRGLDSAEATGLWRAGLWSSCRLWPMMRQGPGITLKCISAIGLGTVQPEQSEASVEGPSTPGLKDLRSG
jgi:hypothetical protein